MPLAPNMRLSRAEIEAWATAYIEAVQSPDHLKEDYPLWWSIERFMLVLPDQSADPEDCWLAILEVLSRNPHERVLGNLAAGPLEDLVDYHGPAFIERIEQHARRDPAFRALLRGVWKGSTPEVWRRIELAQGYHPA